MALKVLAGEDWQRECFTTYTSIARSAQKLNLLVHNIAIDIDKSTTPVDLGEDNSFDKTPLPEILRYNREHHGQEGKHLDAITEMRSARQASEEAKAQIKEMYEIIWSGAVAGASNAPDPGGSVEKLKTARDLVKLASEDMEVWENRLKEVSQMASALAA